MNKAEIPDIDVVIPSEYLDTPLTTTMKNKMCKELGIFDSNARLSKWTTIKNLISTNHSGYEVRDHMITIDGKRTRVSTISFKEDIE